MPLLNLNNVPGEMISGLNDEELDFVTSESNMRELFEMSGSFLDMLNTFSSLAQTCFVILHAGSLSAGQKFFATPANFYNFHPICELYRQKM